MINTLRRAATLWASMATVIFTGLTPAFSQAPTDAQRSAIRSECRSDYETHCASVPPGGAASLQCLQKNMSSLSSGCQTAVRAVEPPAAPKAESAPAAAPKIEKPVCEQAVNAASGGTAAPAAGGAAATAATASPGAAPAAAPAPVLVLRPMRPREELFVLRSACGGDVRALCGGVAPGGGRIVQCLATQAASLSPACQGVLGQFAAR